MLFHINPNLCYLYKEQNLNKLTFWNCLFEHSSPHGQRDPLQRKQTNKQMLTERKKFGYVKVKKCIIGFFEEKYIK